MSKTIEVTHDIGDEAANEKGEIGRVVAVTKNEDGSTSLKIEVPPEAQHVTKAVAVAEAWFSNVLAPHLGDNEKALGTIGKLKFSLREALG